MRLSCLACPQGEVINEVFDVDEVEEAFSNMRRAAGVGDMAEVVDRFATQKKTANILKLQNEKSKKEVTW